jgi:hypothetical protein
MVAAMTAVAAGCAQPSSAGVAVIVTLPVRPPASEGVPSAIVTMVWLKVEP